MGSIGHDKTKRGKALINARWLALHALSCAVIFSFFGCESKIIVDKKLASKTAASATSLKPITAMPGDIVSVTGTGFKSGQENLVKITAASGDEVTVPVTIISDSAATFVMPEGAGLGLTSVVLESNGKQVTGAMGFVANLASNTLPIIIDDASEICSTKQYIDKNGDTQTGTKNCSGSSADLTNLTAGNIKSGVTINGVTGSVTPAPANCAADGATNCVAVDSFPAALASGAASKLLSGQTLAGVSGNVMLPAVGKVLTGTAFGVGGTGSTGTLTIPTASFVLDTAPAYGDPGSLQIPSLTSRGTWNLTDSFLGAGYYAGVSNLPTAATIASGTTITGVAGSASLTPANCSSNGQQSCVATGPYYAGTVCATNGSACYVPTYGLTTQPLKAINYDTINSSAASIRSGTTLGGVPGTLADCSTNGAQGCVTTATYRSGDLTNLTAGNIKSGIVIAGTTGDYPSATYTLPSASGTADLDAATFNAKVKSATAFEYWDSSGARQTGAGDADITAGNISSGVDIFGTSGTYTGTAPNAWDVRVGAVVNGVTGKLKVNCRNRANLARQDMDAGSSVSGIAGNVLTTSVAHGLTSNQTVRLHYAGANPTGADNNTTYYVIYLSTTTFSLSTTSGPGSAMAISGGAGITVHRWQDGTADVWDTIDDVNSFMLGLPTSVISGWTNNDCGGVEATVGDNNVWKDVTTSNGVTASSCGTTATNCTMQDKITGLWWSKRQTDAAWNAALTTCGTTLNTTTYAGNSAAGYNGQTGWRLPTQKEMMDASNHGIRSAASTNWITEGAMTNVQFWSSSTSSRAPGEAWFVYLADGYSNNSGNKRSSAQVVCVR